MELDVAEALRYLGAGRGDQDLRQKMAAVARELTGALRPRYIYRVFALKREEERVLLQNTAVVLTGRTALGMLGQCDQAVLLACTLGAPFDAMLRTEQARDMGRAVMLDACASAWVESGCNAAEREIASRLPGWYLTDRFSPGYGDLPLSIQGAVCGALDAERRLGLHVSESFLMNPVKSVTAVIGLSRQMQRARIRGCGYCSMRESCQLRKGGKRCEI